MISSAAEMLFGKCGAKGNFAEEYAFRSVYIRLSVKQAYNCHRLCLMECYRKIICSINSKPVIFSSVFIFTKKEGTTQ